MDELKAHWPLGKFPTLVDGDRVIPEATCIIEHLAARHSGANRWIPDGEEGRRVRFLDRFFDLHIQGNMQPSVNHAIWPDGEGLAALRGREALLVAYDWLEATLRDDGWAVGDSFHPRRLRCAAAPALFYADWDRGRSAIDAPVSRRTAPVCSPTRRSPARSTRPGLTGTISRSAPPTATNSQLDVPL